METASRPKARRDLGRASRGRTGPGAVSSSCIPGGCRPFADLGLALVGPFAGAVRVGVGAGAAESVRDTGLARLRQGLGHRPYRLAHRTPVRVAQDELNILQPQRDLDSTWWIPECLPYWFLVPLVPRRLLFLQQGRSIQVFLVIRVAVAVWRPGAVVAAAGTASVYRKLAGSSLLGFQSLVSWK